MPPALYLIPVTLGDTPLSQVLPAYNREVVLGIRHFIVEEVRTARRFLRQMDSAFDIDGSTFYPMGKHALEQQSGGRRLSASEIYRDFQSVSSPKRVVRP